MADNPLTSRNGHSTSDDTHLPEPETPVSGAGYTWEPTTPRYREIAELKQELDALRKADEVQTLKEFILLAKVRLARRAARIEDLQTVLHDLELLKHRCEDCHRPLNERKDGKVICVYKNTQVCKACYARRKATRNAEIREAGEE